jgi:hypothetical protein
LAVEFPAVKSSLYLTETSHVVNISYSMFQEEEDEEAVEIQELEKHHWSMK